MGVPAERMSGPRRLTGGAVRIAGTFYEGQAPFHTTAL